MPGILSACSCDEAIRYLQFKKEDKNINKAMTINMVIIKIKALVGTMTTMTRLVVNEHQMRKKKNVKERKTSLVDRIQNASPNSLLLVHRLCIIHRTVQLDGYYTSA